MGRSEDRAMKKNIKKKMSDKQFEMLQERIKEQLVREEAEAQVMIYEQFWAECLIEALTKHGVSGAKQKMIIDDIDNIMMRKVKEKEKILNKVPVAKEIK